MIADLNWEIMSHIPKRNVIVVPDLSDILLFNNK